MIIACPQCNGKFRIDPSALGAAGRTVRCSKCGHKWLQAPPDPAERIAPEAPAAPAPRAPPPSDLGAPDGGERIDWGAPVDRDGEPPGRSRRRSRAAPSARSPSRWPAVAAWTVLVAVVVALGAGLVAFRDDVMTAWPDTNALYDTVDLARPGFRLVLAPPKWREERIDGAPALVVEGEITNPTDRERRVPQQLKLQLFDAQRNELLARTFPSPVRTLGPAKSAVYRIELKDPAENSDELRISFVVDER